MSRLCVGVLLCGLSMLSGCFSVPTVTDWTAGPAQPGNGLLKPADGDKPGDHTYRGTMRFGAADGVKGDPRSSIRSGKFQCGNPPNENKHCYVTISVNATFRDGEKIRVRFQRTTRENGRNVVREVKGYIQDSGNPRTYSLSYPACAENMEVILDWVAGGDGTSIASEVYITTVNSGCALNPMTNRALTSQGGVVDRRHKLKDANGNDLPAALEPRRVN